MVRRALAGNAYGSATVAAPVLRSTVGGPHLPPGPLPLPHGERKGEHRVLARKNIGNPLRNGRTGTVRAR